MSKYINQLIVKYIFMIDRNHYGEVAELMNKYEETDVAQLLHAEHTAASGFSAGSICSEHTYLCLDFSE